MPTHNLLHRLIFSFLLLVSSATTFASPNNLQRAAVLYPNGHPVTGEFGEITSIAATKTGFLYASFSGFSNPDNTRTIELHTWNIADPTNPQLVARLDLSDPGDGPAPDDPSLLSLHDMTIFDGHLFAWRNFRMVAYRIGNDGSLERVIHEALADNLNQNLSRPSFLGGRYLSTERQLLTNNEFLNAIDTLGYSAAEDLLNENILIRLDPTTPFAVKKSQQYGLQYTVMDPPPTGTLNGLPARLSLADNKIDISLLKYSQDKSRHITSLWAPILSQIFRSKTLKLSLQQLSERIVSNLKPTTLLSSIDNLVVRNFALPANVTLSARVGAFYDQQALLSSLIASFGISLDDSLQFAIEKILASYIGANLEASLRGRIAGGAIDAWSESLFVKVPRSTRGFATEIKQEFSGRLKKLGLERYLVDIVMGPLIDLPPVFRLRLGALISRIANSDFGNSVTTALTTFNTAIPAKRLLKTAGFTVPRCFNIPETANQFLKLVLTTGGTRLDVRNYAFVELLKLLSYYRGNDNYSNVLNTVKREIATLHDDLSSELSVGFFKGLNLQAQIGETTKQIFARVENSIAVKPIVTKTIAARIGAVLAVNNISMSSSVREVLEAHGLYLEASRLPAGISLATNANLTVTLGNLRIGTVAVDRLIRASSNVGISSSSAKTTFNQELVKLINNLWIGIFGEISLSTTLQNALNQLIARNLNPQTVGRKVEALIGATLNSLSDSIKLPAIIGDARLAAQGNCLAQYKIGLAALAAAPAIGEFAVAAGVALGEAQDAGLDFVVRTLLSSFLSQIFEQSAEDYPSWGLKLVPETLNLTIAQFTNRQARFIDPFIAGEYIGFVLRDLNSQGWIPGYNRNVEVVFAKPSDVAGTLITLALGEWDTVGTVRFDPAGYLLVGGQRLRGGNGGFEPAVTLVNLLESGNPIFERRGDDITDLQHATEIEIIRASGDYAATTIDGKVLLLRSNAG